MTNKEGQNPLQDRYNIRGAIYVTHLDEKTILDLVTQWHYVSPEEIGGDREGNPVYSFTGYDCAFLRSYHELTQDRWEPSQIIELKRKYELTRRILPSIDDILSKLVLPNNTQDIAVARENLFHLFLSQKIEDPREQQAFDIIKKNIKYFLRR